MWRRESRPATPNPNELVCLWNTGEVYTVELYARVRRAVHVEGMSEREAARQFGIARSTVRKMLKYSIPPGYRWSEEIVTMSRLNIWSVVVRRERDFEVALVAQLRAGIQRLSTRSMTPTTRGCSASCCG